MRLMKYKMMMYMISLAVTVTACYDEKDPVAEIITATGKGYYPVSANTFIDLINGGSITANRVYKPATNISFELQYWSESSIKEINLYRTEGSGAREKVFSKTYAEVAAFSRRKSADTLVFQYTTPATTNTTAKLEVEIVNENTLLLLRSITLQSKL
jgi:hypothetical protein